MITHFDDDNYYDQLTEFISCLIIALTRIMRFRVISF